MSGYPGLMPLSRSLSTSVVVVTGASSGIGAATSLALAQRGATLVLAARGAVALEEIARRCRARGVEALAVPTDVADAPAVERLAAAAEERFGRIDAWINDASVALYGRLLEMPLEEVRRILDVNLFGYLHGARSAVPRLRAAGGGVIVMVASALGEVTVPYFGAYTMSKHALVALCATLRQELRADGVTDVSVCTVLPGTFDTPLFAQAGNRTGRRIRPLPPVNPPYRAARRIVRLLESPRRQAHVGLGSTALSWQWRIAPGLSERLLTRYAQVGQFVRGTGGGVATEPTPGNLFVSRNEEAKVEGGWRSL